MKVACQNKDGSGSLCPAFFWRTWVSCEPCAPFPLRKNRRSFTARTNRWLEEMGFVNALKTHVVSNSSPKFSYMSWVLPQAGCRKKKETEWSTKVSAGNETRFPSDQLWYKARLRAKHYGDDETGDFLSLTKPVPLCNSNNLWGAQGNRPA